MKAISVLYIGTHAEISATVSRLLNSYDGIQGETAAGLMDVQRLCSATSFDLVLLGNGLNPTEESAIRQFLADQSPDTKIVDHYGGGSGLLMNEILDALNDQHTGNTNKL